MKIEDLPFAKWSDLEEGTLIFYPNIVNDINGYIDYELILIKSVTERSYYNDVKCCEITSLLRLIDKSFLVTSERLSYTRVITPQFLFEVDLSSLDEHSKHFIVKYKLLCDFLHSYDKVILAKKEIITMIDQMPIDFIYSYFRLRNE